MNPVSASQPIYSIPDAGSSAVEGIRDQLQRLARNVAEVARGEGSESFAAGSRDRALVEQTEIMLALRANAKSLASANQAIGTIIDLKV